MDRDTVSSPCSRSRPSADLGTETIGQEHWTAVNQPQQRMGKQRADIFAGWG